MDSHLEQHSSIVSTENFATLTHCFQNCCCPFTIYRNGHEWTANAGSVVNQSRHRVDVNSRAVNVIGYVDGFLYFLHYQINLKTISNMNAIAPPTVSVPISIPTQNRMSSVFVIIQIPIDHIHVDTRRMLHQSRLSRQEPARRWIRHRRRIFRHWRKRSNLWCWWTHGAQQYWVVRSESGHSSSSFFQPFIFVVYVLYRQSVNNAIAFHVFFLLFSKPILKNHSINNEKTLFFWVSS